MTIESVLSGESRWCIIEGDCRDLLASIPDGSIDHTITDPPYSEHVHSKHMVGASLPDTAEFECRFNRKKELGFEAIDRATMETISDQIARVTKRWALVFCNVEICHEWIAELTVAGMDYVRTGAWDKIGGTPQFTGDRPAAAFETIVIAHQPGRKRWNGGGKRGMWSCPIEANRLGNRGARVHTTQKPLPLAVQLVEDFTDPDDVILDPFCGFATFGIAAIRLGRRYIGMELKGEATAENYAEASRERLRAEDEVSTHQARRAGQCVLFGGTK